jgi:hypothetical protein
MIAQGKREARRPGLRPSKQHGGLKGRNNIPPFSGLSRFFCNVTTGDALRACLALYSAPLALFESGIVSPASDIFSSTASSEYEEFPLALPWHSL